MRRWLAILSQSRYNRPVKRILIISACIFAIAMAVFVKLPEKTIVQPVPVPSLKPVYTPVASPKTPDISADILFTLVNAWRSENGYLEYKISPTACTFAQTRVKEIQTDFSHDGLYVHAKELPSGSYISENLSEGFNYAYETMDAWVKSPTHLDNLKKDYTHSCIKCEKGYCVHIFSYY